MIRLLAEMVTSPVHVCACVCVRTCVCECVWWIAERILLFLSREDEGVSFLAGWCWMVLVVSFEATFHV